MISMILAKKESTKKLFNMYIHIFGLSVKVKVVEKLFFVRTKAVYNEGIRAAKKDFFREVLLDLVGINFGNCRISIDP